MDAATVIPIAISAVSLVVSCYVAYKTFLQKFLGKIWYAQAIVLTHVDQTPSIGLACFVENKGAQPGYLEDVRLAVKHFQSDSKYSFYPLLTRDDYSIFESYVEKDWYPFSGFYLLPKDKSSKYMLFKPLNDHFNAQEGDYQIEIEVRWRDTQEWEKIPHDMKIEVSSELANNWNDPNSPAYQVFSNQILQSRIGMN